MSVSTAQFLAWLRSGAPRLTLLAEPKFAYETGSGPAEGTMYFSDRQYRTAPSDAPPNVRYRDTIESCPAFARAIDGRTLGGRGSLSMGALTFNSTDGSIDFLLDVIIDGRDVAFSIGDGGDAASGIPAWARSDFRAVNVAAVSAVRATNDTEIAIDLISKTFLLDAAIVGTPIATGPNAGKPKPVVLGRIKNMDVTPYLLDSTALTYAINDFALDPSLLQVFDALSVRDSGLDLRDSSVSSPLFFFDNTNMTANAATDTLSYSPGTGFAADDVIMFRINGGTMFTGLSSGVQYWVLASGLTATDFKVSLTKNGTPVDITGTVLTASGARVMRQRYYFDSSAATIQLSSPPAGRITLDMVAADAGGEMTTTPTPHLVFKYILKHYTALSASGYDAAAFDAITTLETSEALQYGSAILDRTNVLDVLDGIAQASRSWYCPNASGVITAGRLDLVNLDSATSIDTITTHDIDGDLAVDNQPLRWGKVNVNARKNVAIQSDGLASAVSATNKTLWGKDFQKRASTTDPAGTDYLGNWWDYHKSAIDSDPIALPIDSGQQTACDAITALFKPWTRTYRLTVFVDKYFNTDGTAKNPGDCVTLVYPRYGLSAGKKMRILSVQPRFSDRLCDLVLVRQVTPDYSSTSHTI